MKYLKDDILLSRLLQFSLLGTMLLMVALLLVEEPVFSAQDNRLSPLPNTTLPVEQPADSLNESSPQVWMSRPFEWVQEHILLPLGHW